MNRLMKTFAIALALCASAVSAVAAGRGGGGAGKVHYSDLSVMISLEKNKDVMEHMLISSWSMGDAAGGDVNGDGLADIIVGAGVGGHVKVFSGAFPASALRLCQSRATLPTVVLESDGKRHVFQNVVFDKCPPAGSTSGTFTLTFNGQTTSPNAAQRAASTWDRPNARITGLAAAKIDARLLSLRVRGNRASLVVALPASAPEPSAPAVSEIVVTKLADAASWSFSGTHVLYQDISIPASARGSSKVIEMTIDFQSMKGSRADYNDPENPLK